MDERRRLASPTNYESFTFIPIAIFPHVASLDVFHNEIYTNTRSLSLTMKKDHNETFIRTRNAKIKLAYSKILF